jgi:aspartyl-tRNA(Asn)/glutamyl-tRNA(Gln) amidotransferase subunit B
MSSHDQVTPVDLAVDAALLANHDVVKAYRDGQSQALGFLVGQVMQMTGGHANVSVVQTTLRERLGDTPAQALSLA